MKNTTTAGLGLLLLLSCAAPVASQQFNQEAAATRQPDQTKSLEGAWRTQDAAGNAVVMLVQDGFFTVARFNQDGKQFLGTSGGTYTAADGKFSIRYEFNTMDSTQVGTSASADYKLENNRWTVGQGEATDTWERIDENKSTSPLAGTWRITGRERDGEMNTMRPGPRKTLKVLTGTRFQWIAFNSETGEFSGTGGGTYTARDGKYTETIEFFSRDSSRVGMQLSFNYEVKDGNWHHSGQSSTGNKINEIWSRISEQ